MPEDGVEAIRLCERLATESLDLARVHLGMDRRRLAGRTAEGGAAWMQHHEQHGRRAPALAGLPALQHVGPLGCTPRAGHRNLETERPLSEEQPGRAETVMRWRRPTSRREIGEKLCVVCHVHREDTRNDVAQRLRGPVSAIALTMENVPSGCSRAVPWSAARNRGAARHCVGAVRSRGVTPTPRPTREVGNPINRQPGSGAGGVRLGRGST